MTYKGHSPIVPVFVVDNTRVLPDAGNCSRLYEKNFEVSQALAVVKGQCPTKASALSSTWLAVDNIRVFPV